MSSDRKHWQSHTRSCQHKHGVSGSEATRSGRWLTQDPRDSSSWLLAGSWKRLYSTRPHHHWQGQPKDEQKACQILNGMSSTTSWAIDYCTPSQSCTPQLSVKCGANLSPNLGAMPAEAGGSPSLLRLCGWLGYCEQHETKCYFPVFTAWFCALLPQNRSYTAPKVWWGNERENT